MKIIFLDIDGVLNSVQYDRSRSHEQGNIDETRLPLLKEVVDETQALIVLSSSWRKHWSKESCQCDNIGKELNDMFSKYQLSIYDRTTCSDNNDRADEIRMWLQQHESTTAYAILDDIALGWGADLQEHLVKTNSRIGRGLEYCNTDTSGKNTECNKVRKRIYLYSEGALGLRAVLFHSCNLAVKCIAKSGKEHKEYSYIRMSLS